MTLTCKNMHLGGWHYVWISYMKVKKLIVRSSVFIPTKGSLDYALLLCRWHADGSSHTKMEPDSSLLETHTNPRTVDHRWISYVALSHLDLPGCSHTYPVHTSPHLWSYLHTLLCPCQYRQNGPGLWFPANYSPCNFPMLCSVSVPPSMNCLQPLGSSSPSLRRLPTTPDLSISYVRFWYICPKKCWEERQTGKEKQ